MVLRKLDLSHLQREADRLAESLVLCDPVDPAAWRALCQHLGKISRLPGMPKAIGDAAGNAAATVEQQVAAADWDPKAARTVLGEAVESFQRLCAESSPGSPRRAEASADAAPEAAGPPAPAPFGEAEMPLFREFVSEAREHLDAADLNLLALDANPRDQAALDAVFRAFHTIKGVSICLNLADISELGHEAESLLDRARKGTLLLHHETVDIAFNVVDTLRRMVSAVERGLSTRQPIEREEGLAEVRAQLRAMLETASAAPVPCGAPIAPPPARKLGEILVETGLTTPAAIETALQQQAASGGSVKLGEQLVRGGHVPAKEIAHALRRQSSGEDTPVRLKDTIKVDAERLDRLLDMIGELVIAESMVSQAGEVRKLASPVLSGHLRQLDKITRELQELATSLRMVPVRPVFHKMARLAHDLARKTGKHVDFSLSGEDTELDKAVVEKISDPLVHLVRNAIDHGIEASVAERRRAGKEELSRVQLRAYHQAGNIHIEVEDDGRGLDRSAILAKAKAKGLIRGEDGMTDQEVFSLIFLPGFSTAETVTDVSGRGVGMDVVRRNVEALRGQVDIRTQKGKGSVFSLRIPLTLAIIDGMVVSVGGERYILPILPILRSVRPKPGDVFNVLGHGEVLRLQDQLLPVFRLHRLFAVPNAKTDPCSGLIVVIEDGGRQTGLLVDELLGQQQVVIKGLGESMQGLVGIAGGAILPDGQVGLILDASGLIRLAHQKQGARPAVAAAAVGDPA
jgi:two-component system chemotaxis sensor kinase CheA